jgi:hypothetical protein
MNLLAFIPLVVGVIIASAGLTLIRRGHLSAPYNFSARGLSRYVIGSLYGIAGVLILLVGILAIPAMPLLTGTVGVMLAGAVVIFVAATFLGHLLSRRAKQGPQNGSGDTYKSASEVLRELNWDNLLRVEVLTTNQGPIMTDIFWKLVDTRATYMVPMGSPGEDRLLRRLQSLPGFNNESLANAMTSVSNAQFLCWERSIN